MWFTLNKIPVIYKGKDYLMFVRYASGYCEILEVGESYNQMKLVHISELKFKENKPSKKTNVNSDP